jgi:ParB/RepB/Spo0J family partition protein
MNLREVNPGALTISDMNERTRDPLIEDMAASVGQQGVVQPPIVRENGDGLEVVVGQRRTLAARRAGLDALPVVVMGWNDADALEASITENIEGFRERVTDNERAAAVTRLMELRDCSQREAADRLGVDESSVRDWLEGTREEWEGTAFEPEFKKKRQEGERSGTEQDTDRYTAASGGAQEVSASAGGSTLRSIRSATEDLGKGEREEMAHRVERGDMSRSDVREVAKSVERGADFEDATDSVTEARDTSGGGTIGVELTLPGDVSTELTNHARGEGVSNEEVIRRALREYLGIAE